jgi:uncharacterized protein involved in exopolysaccharide biosynthesis
MKTLDTEPDSLELLESHQSAFSTSEAESQTSLIKPIECVWLLWNHRRRIFRTCLAAMLISALVAFLLPKKYTATTQLMPADYNTGSMMSLAVPALSAQGSGSGGSVMGLASQLLGMNSSGDLFRGVLRSRTVEDNIIRQFELQEFYSKKYIEDAREKLEAITTIEIDKKTGILSISVEEHNPQMCAEIAQAYVQELNRTLAEVNTSAARKERIFIEGRLAEVRAELDKSSQEFSVFASQNSAINIPEQAKAMVEAAAALEAQLIAAQSELKGLQQIFTDNNVRVKQAKARVGELRAQLDRFGGKNVDPLKDNVLNKGELYPSIRQLPLLGVKYLDLFRNTKVNEAVYELLVKQHEIAKIQEAREVASVQILDPAVVPTKKSSPRRLRIIAAAVLLTFAFASVWTLGPVVWGRIDPQDPRRVLAETVVLTTKTQTWDSPSLLRLRNFARHATTKFRFFRSNG